MIGANVRKSGYLLMLIIGANVLCNVLYNVLYNGANVCIYDIIQWRQCIIYNIVGRYSSDFMEHEFRNASCGKSAEINPRFPSFCAFGVGRRSWARWKALNELFCLV